MSRINAYTLGDTVAYNTMFAQSEGKSCTKCGPHVEESGEVYEGGCVFRTVEDADRWRVANDKSHWSVFGLVLPNGWDLDVRPYLAGEDFQRLNRDVEVRRLESERTDEPAQG